MAGFWDERQYNEQLKTSREDAAEEVLTSLEEETDEQDTDEEDARLESDVEQRLEVASLYRLLLVGSFFNSDSKAARLVTRRIRRFVTDELKSLLGMAQPQNDAVPSALAQLTPARVEALVRIADKVLEREASPSLAPVQVPPPAPVEQKPTLRQRDVPQPQVVTKTPAKPGPKPGVKTKKVEKSPAPTVAESKIKEVNPDAKPGEKKVFRKEQVKNGRLIQEFIDEKGDRIAPGAVIDRTPQVRPPDALPMPSPTQVGSIMEVHSMATAQVSENSLGQIMTPVRRITL